MTDAPSWLPPDQIATTAWPVVGERAPSPDAPAAEAWTLRIQGLVAHAVSYTLAELRALHHADLTLDVHCVTGWSHQAMTFTGLPLAQVLANASPLAAARFVRFVAASERDHDTTLPLPVALAHTWLVQAAEGAPLAQEHGGPLRSVTQGRYFYKSVKWLRTIELLADDPGGYWERVDGYHAQGDPWPGDERYTTGNLTGEALEKFKHSENFRRWHRKTIRRAPLAGWTPRTSALGPLALKGCDLRGAQLAGAELAGANFSLSDLRGADLRGANLRGADLEGARFAGADLRGADLTGAALTATSFFEGHPDRNPAQVEGACFQGVTGLLEAEAAWLNGLGLA